MSAAIRRNVSIPAAIAMVMPVDIFFSLFSVGDGGFCGGVCGRGEGAGPPEHGARGGPHNRELPKNDPVVKLCREAGMGPVRLLLLTLKLLSFGRFISGMGPDRELF